GDGSGAIELTTGRLERGDGRRLSRDEGVAKPSDPDSTRKEVTTGVKPDHAIGQSGARARRFSPPRSSRAPDQEPNLASDADVQEAVRLLQKLVQAII
ncbi:MAG TPA: hypothetical protein VHS97_19550, partial [Isosphaeraceae bacterium]|nr:hypothetical protein [Isosphaeraceae bacterium]